jgi:hypothetical protein
MAHAGRKSRLEHLLIEHQPLWRPQPFKVETPDWCAAQPALTAELLALDDDSVDRLGVDSAALIGLVARHLPALAELADLIDLPASAMAAGASCAAGAGAAEAHLYADIPGRKQAQIEAYAAAIGRPCAPVLEWCAGKGHLGRLLAHRWHWPVASLEIDGTLCESGEALARRARVDCMQHFIRADALAPGATRHLGGRHAVALHACGDLHTRLVAGAIEQASPAFDLAPCCYYRTASATYRPFAPTGLNLNHDDLRLAVTETVTASPRQRRQSRRALAWKLGWVELRSQLTGEAGYRPFPPVPEAWLRGDFAGFIEHMIQRTWPDGLPAGAALPSAQASGGHDRFEAIGTARAARMLRLQLLRLAFRRPLEVWLLMDMAVHLERQGYTVTVAPFCPSALTPRNLLLSARRG